MRPCSLMVQVSFFCDRPDTDVTDSSEYSAMSSIPLTQLLIEMNAASSDSQVDSEPQLLHQFQCCCITAEHQTAGRCIEHFKISRDEERNLNNIDGNLMVYLFSCL